MHGFDETAADRKAQPGSRHAAVGGLGAIEFVEDVRKIVGWKPRTFVFDRQRDARRIAPAAHLDAFYASLDEVLKPIRLPDDPMAASYAVGGVLQIELTRKQQLLELPDAASRLRVELDLLRREARLLSDGAMPPVATADLRYHPN